MWLQEMVKAMTWETGRSMYRGTREIYRGEMPMGHIATNGIIFRIKQIPSSYKDREGARHHVMPHSDTGYNE